MSVSMSRNMRGGNSFKPQFPPRLQWASRQISHVQVTTKLQMEFPVRCPFSSASLIQHISSKASLRLCHVSSVETEYRPLLSVALRSSSMDGSEDQTPFAAVSAQTSRFSRVCRITPTSFEGAFALTASASYTNPTSTNPPHLPPTAGQPPARSSSFSSSGYSWRKAGTSVCLPPPSSLSTAFLSLEDLTYNPHLE